MPTLKEIVLVPGNRPKVIADCVKVIEEEVDAKSGLTGLAVKGAFAVVKAVKPGFVPEAVDHMLDDFVGRLEPFWSDAQTRNEPIGPLMNGRAGEVADALLAISDERAGRAQEPDAEEGLREASPHRQEARRSGCPAYWPPAREVHLGRRDRLTSSPDHSEPAERRLRVSASSTSTEWWR